VFFAFGRFYLLLAGQLLSMLLDEALTFHRVVNLITTPTPDSYNRIIISLIYRGEKCHKNLLRSDESVANLLGSDSLPVCAFRLFQGRYYRKKGCCGEMSKTVKRSEFPVSACVDVFWLKAVDHCETSAAHVLVPWPPRRRGSLVLYWFRVKREACLMPLRSHRRRQGIQLR
jgi:hypothetical protein